MKEMLVFIVSAVIIFIGGMLIGVGFKKDKIAFGGLIHNVTESFDEGIAVDGTTRISGTGGATFTTGSFSSTLAATGATTLSSTLAVTATSTLTGALVANNLINTFGNAATSTVQVGAASKSGCLILGDSANGASVVYITATGSTITASTTKPAACQTAL